MGTTVDDLIELKDQAVAACAAAAAAWASSKLDAIESAARLCEEAVERGELYDAAEESDAVSIEDYEENYDGQPDPHEPEGLDVWEPKDDDPHEPEGEPRRPA